MKSFIRGAGLLLLAMGSSAVMAVPITGDISFAGTSNVTGTNLSFGNVIVMTTTGDFASEGVAFPQSATFTSFDYAANPFTAISPLWTVGGFSFDLETIDIGTPGTGVDLALSGTGVLMRAGYDNTAYTWAYSGNINSSNNSGTMTFSAASLPAQIPEPGSLALLGLGLVGFAVTGYGRRRTQA